MPLSIISISRTSSAHILNYLIYTHVPNILQKVYIYKVIKALYECDHADQLMGGCMF